MSDGKYFQRGKVHELHAELQEARLNSKPKHSKQVLKKIIANMTMGSDMSQLATDLLPLASIPDPEIKKLVFLFVVTYAKTNPEIAAAAIPAFLTDTKDENPLVRALAIRNMTNIPVEKVWLASCEPLRRALVDKDPYVCKAAAISVAKLYSYNDTIVKTEGLLERLTALLNHENPNVLANAVLSLMEIASHSNDFVFSLNTQHANKILSALEESNEWSQAYLLEAIMTVCPEDPLEANQLSDRIAPRLQHSNSGVVITAIRIIIYLSSFMKKAEEMITMLNKCGPPLVTLLHGSPEVQFVALRNIQLILQKHKNFLQSEIKVFFCKYNDPIYVKLAKLEIIFQLVDESNSRLVLAELKEYSQEIDVDFVRKSVRSIGRCAIKIESCSDKCVDTLVDLIETKVDYVVQEAIVVIKDIFRKYPNRFENIIRILCENLNSLEDQEAKSSMIWIIGHYSDRIDNADQLLSSFLDSVKDDSAIVQFSLLTAIVKLFIKRPSVGQNLVPKILKFTTEDVDNPDLRDRGFMYWRLLSTDPVSAKAIVLGEQPTINTESGNFDPSLLSRLLYNISTLSSLSHRPAFMKPVLANRLLQQFTTSSKVLESEEKSSNPDLKTSTSSLPIPAISSVPVMNPYQVDDDFNFSQPKSHLISDFDRLALQEPVNEPPAFVNGLPIDLFSAAPGTYTNSAPILDRSASPDIFALPNTNSNNSAPVNQVAQSTLVQSSNPFIISSSVPSASLSASAHNPFSNPQSSQSPPLNSTYTTSGQSMAIGSGMNSTPPDLGQTINPIIDPFQTSTMTKSMPLSVKAPVSLLFADNPILLDSNNGRGLEIKGEFSKKNGIVYLDMNFTNKGQVALNDFAILFNKNTFGIVPAQPLSMCQVCQECQSSVGPILVPNQSVDYSLPLKADANPVFSSPANNIQVAVKTNLGILYFQTLLPLHYLFKDGGGIPAAIWPKMWNESFTVPEFRSTFPLGPTITVGNLSQKLGLQNFYVIAERQLENNVNAYYGGCTLMDNTVFLAEIQLDKDRNCTVSSKTFSAALSVVFNASILGILG